MRRERVAGAVLARMLQFCSWDVRRRFASSVLAGLMLTGPVTAIAVLSSETFAQAVNYLDEAGTVHFADSPDQVPLRYRSQVVPAKPEIQNEEQYKEAQRAFKRKQQELKKQQREQQRMHDKLLRKRQKELAQQQKELERELEKKQLQIEKSKSNQPDKRSGAARGSPSSYDQDPRVNRERERGR